MQRAQAMSYPHDRRVFGFYPRRHDSRNRAWCTDLPALQVRVTKEETEVTHRKGNGLLLSLCIYKEIKKKTRVKSNSPPGTRKSGGELLRKKQGSKTGAQCAA
jgi:hypothetical protein